MADLVERRKDPRSNVRWPITIFTDKGTIEGETRNITTVGIFIRSKQHLLEDENYRILIRPPQQEPIQIKGHLKWSNPVSNDSTNSDSIVGMGFCFVELSENDRHLLEQVISVNSLLEEQINI